MFSEVELMWAMVIQEIINYYYNYKKLLLFNHYTNIMYIILLVKL